MLFTINEVARRGETRPPIPGRTFGTFEADDAVGALDAYSVAEGFSPYSATEMLNEVTVWNDEKTIASAPFTNTEVMALPAGREILVHLNIEIGANDKRSAAEVASQVETAARDALYSKTLIGDPLTVTVPLAEEV